MIFHDHLTFRTRTRQDYARLARASHPLALSIRSKQRAPISRRWSAHSQVGLEVLMTEKELEDDEEVGVVAVRGAEATRREDFQHARLGGDCN